mmetsp:Transcript_23133/g.43474  ORF Transcript_23133/g.43474 Transcript_23133/m.43474 type:complete len:385 (-) Transcript_23133:45-1199(-)
MVNRNSVSSAPRKSRHMRSQSQSKHSPSVKKDIPSFNVGSYVFTHPGDHAARVLSIDMISKVAKVRWTSSNCIGDAPFNVIDAMFDEEISCPADLMGARDGQDWSAFRTSAIEVLGNADLSTGCVDTYAKEILSIVRRELGDPQYNPPPFFAVTACGEKPTVVMAMISVTLSHQTPIEKSAPTMMLLWKTYGDVQGLKKSLLVSGGEDRFLDVIKPVGLGTNRLRTILEILDYDQLYGGGEVDSLEKVKDRDVLDDTEAMKRLTQVWGIGPKLASCVLSFTCHRPLLALDSNVVKMAHQLAWFKTKSGKKKEIKNYADEMFWSLNGLCEKVTSSIVIPATIHGSSNFRAEVHCWLLRLGQILNNKSHSKHEEASRFIKTWKVRK